MTTVLEIVLLCKKKNKNLEMETVFQNMGTYKYRRNKMIIQNKSRTSCKFRVTINFSDIWKKSNELLLLLDFYAIIAHWQQFIIWVRWWEENLVQQGLSG